jgi:hypothetical protein
MPLELANAKGRSIIAREVEPIDLVKLRKDLREFFLYVFSLKETNQTFNDIDDCFTYFL